MADHLARRAVETHELFEPGQSYARIRRDCLLLRLWQVLDVDDLLVEVAEIVDVLAEVAPMKLLKNCNDSDEEVRAVEHLFSLLRAPFLLGCLA